MTEQRVEVREQGRAYVAGRDQIFYRGEPPYTIEAIDRGPAVPPQEGFTRQPSYLLDARHGVVPFFEEGRSAEMDELATWRDAGGDRLAVRLLHGRGGQGKTRLAAEFADRSAALGWAVGCAFR